MNPKYFPMALITLNICAAVAYGFSGDFKRATYWCAAAVLTSCVTF